MHVNRDVERLKLELAGNSYEATLQTCVSITFGVLVSLLVLDITLSYRVHLIDLTILSASLAILLISSLVIRLLPAVLSMTSMFE